MHVCYLLFFFSSPLFFLRDPQSIYVKYGWMNEQAVPCHACRAIPSFHSGIKMLSVVYYWHSKNTAGANNVGIYFFFVLRFFHSLNTIHFCYNISFLFSFFSYKCDVKEQTKTNGKFFAFISFSKWILTAHFCSNVSQQAKNGQQDWRTCTIYFRRQDIFLYFRYLHGNFKQKNKNKK